jgi:squalene-associated FAD-dependent desaturase
MLRLARLRDGEALARVSIGQWLREQGQSAAAIERFWSVVLVSALSETVERASLAAARKVFVDGFLGSRRAYEMSVPNVALEELYGQRTKEWLEKRGIAVHLGAAVERIEQADGGLQLVAAGQQLRRDLIVLAVPWTHVAGLLSSTLADRLPWVARLRDIQSAPITSVHLWFDRPITSLPHAVLVGRLSQWVFARSARPSSPAPRPHYYQVVISASHELRGRDRDAVIAEVRRDLAAVWPKANEATLLAARLITQHDAVFSPRPGVDELRPPQKTDVPGLFIAGDWTQTLWPATMEGAVRSGYLAAEAILAALGTPRRLLVPDLPRGRLARWLIGKA